MQFGSDVVRVFGLSPSGYVAMDDHGWIGLTGERAAPDFNMCFVARTASNELIEQYVKEISERELPAVLIVDEDAPELVDAAAAAGWTAVGTIPVMVWEDGPAPRASERFAVRIATQDEHDAVCGLIAQGFSIDEEAVIRALPKEVFTEGIEAWVVEDDGELVGTGTFVRSGDHVGVYSMATPAPNQRRGIGRAVLETAMAHHLSAGAKRFTLEASNAGFHLYEQLGYRAVARPPAFAGDFTHGSA